ncbi:MAG: 4Fe-4S binding protein [Eubacterium sp.]|nr:4Fe-4S binding protein [Eubacterium sp.]
MKQKKQAFRRKCIQLLAALIYNANLKGFGDASIFRGQIKGICVPGLNCYSCPGAIGSCPLGSLQNALSAVNYRLPLYILGILLLFGLLLGRVVCGFLCPFGLIQELLYKIPLPKIKKSRWTRYLSKLKYVILVIFVIFLPLWFGLADGLPVPAFCKYICPAGTLEGGILLVSSSPDLQSMTGALFAWKIALMVFFLGGVIFIYRGFCRFICPLGALYALFAKVSLFGIKVDESKCSHCGACVRYCKMDIQKPGDAECIQCGECAGICRQQAIQRKVCMRGKMTCGKGENTEKEAAVEKKDIDIHG